MPGSTRVRSVPRRSRNTARCSGMFTNIQVNCQINKQTNKQTMKSSLTRKYVTKYNKRYILSTFTEDLTSFPMIPNSLKLLKVQLLQSVYFLLFSLYFTHFSVHYQRHHKLGWQDVTDTKTDPGNKTHPLLWHGTILTFKKQLKL